MEIQSRDRAAKKKMKKVIPNTCQELQSML
ncbi:hypothetical protein BSTP3_002 [Bacillus phage BSTP3]|nr:hypothetical protein BSTP3_002 [Bacillus phage BSTP3]